MTEIYNHTIDHPGAWTSAAIGGREGLTHRISDAQRRAIEDLVARTASKPADAVTRQDFDHPAVNDLMSAVRDQVMDGHGAVIVSGLDMQGRSVESFERVFWGLGTHLGDAAPQSYRRDRIGRVQKEADNPTGRGYLTDLELKSHTDFHEILALASYERAEEGGESGIVSSLALHNLLFAEHPELLKPLYEGFFHESDDKVSEFKVPVFGCVDGKVSCYYHIPFIRNAARKLGVELPADLSAAFASLNDYASRKEVRADFMLEPGEMIFWHNFTALHSRTAFQDSDAHRRLLLRLWINVPHGRPIPPEFHERARYMDEVHESGRAAIQYVADGGAAPAQAAQ